MNEIAKAVVPDLREDYLVAYSNDRVNWYKINVPQKTLYIPPTKILKTNMRELDNAIEALRNFAKVDFEDLKLFDWSDESLELEEYGGEEVLRGIERLNEVLTPGTLVSVDIESRNVLWEENHLLSIGFAYSDNAAIGLFDIPFQSKRRTRFRDDIQEALQRIFDRTDLIFVWHNGKFDCGRLAYICGLKARVDEDTMLKHYACINESKGTHGLKDLGPLYVQAPNWDSVLDTFKREWCRKNKVKLNDFMYDMIPVSILVPYMLRDCIATRRLIGVFSVLAREDSDFIYGKLIEASNVFTQIELNGIDIDVDYLGDLEYTLDNQIADANKHLDEAIEEVWSPLVYCQETGAKYNTNLEKFNMGSPKQLKWLLSKVLDYQVLSTDAATIDYLITMVKEGDIVSDSAVRFLTAVGEVRKYTKYMDTYVSGIRERLCGDLRIRGTYNLHGTETGRLSASKPNMQNIPRNAMIKNLFISGDDFILLQTDYSQAELRGLAVLSGDEWLTQVYVDDGDLHDAVSIAMFGENFDKEERNLAKTINFGIAYGRGPSSLATKFKTTMKEAVDIVDSWFKPMPKVREYIQTRRKMARNGDPCISVFGRERHFVVTTENLYHVENEYINTPIQSLASDLTLFSVIDLQKWIDESNLSDDVFICINVHDSIVLRVRDRAEIIDAVAESCKRIMKEIPERYIPNLKVPFKADIEVGYKWGELKKWQSSTCTTNTTK